MPHSERLFSARRECAKRVVVLEKAPQQQRGGNTHFSGAVFRHVFNDVKELDRSSRTPRKSIRVFMRASSRIQTQAFRDDLMRVTNGRSDPELADILIDHRMTRCAGSRKKDA
jgi:tricarballylate dehydrogenase